MKGGCSSRPADARAAQRNCMQLKHRRHTMVLLASTYDQSRFFKAADLKR